MAKEFAGACLAIFGVALALAGCSPAPVIERLPTELGGLPSGAPAAPRTGYRYRRCTTRRRRGPPPR